MTRDALGVRTPAPIITTPCVTRMPEPLATSGGSASWTRAWRASSSAVVQSTGTATTPTPGNSRSRSAWRAAASRLKATVTQPLWSRSIQMSS